MRYIAGVLVLRGFLFLLIVVALAAVVLSLVRRSPRQRSSGTDEDDDTSAAPAALPPPGGNALERPEVLRKLHELALGAALEPTPSADHTRAAAAIGATLQTAATDPRYAPRRPLLLPQLLSAAGDGDTSRRELAGLIARDPALVGSLLRLANSAVYRRNAQPIESVERAVAVLGTQGIRSLAAAALVQPVFRTSGGQRGKFPEIVWEHTYRAAAAAEAHALSVENTDPFAAQLLALVAGLGAIVVFRVAADQYAQSAPLEPNATAIASLLDEHTADVARRIAASWELSDRVLEALDDQAPGKPARPASALGRSLRFGLVAGALSVLRANGAIDDETARASLAAAGGVGPKIDRMWERLGAPSGGGAEQRRRR
jgi:HD-like signal output (HDOD) protein